MTVDGRSVSHRLRIGISGCGRVAEHHLRFINDHPEAEIVGFADVDRDRAEELARKAGIHTSCTTIDELMDRSRPDVIHITTPPQFHYAQALQAVEQGVHVLVEKPTTLQHAQCLRLYDRAKNKGAVVCPDFIQLFHPAMQRAIQVIEQGRLGSVTHVTSYLGLDLDIPELQESPSLHWSYKLPGGVLQNYLSHPLYLVLYFCGMPSDVHVVNKTLGNLPQRLTDHVEILLDGERATGTITMSSAISPSEYNVRIVCTQGAVTVDFQSGSVLVEQESVLPRSVSRALTNFNRARQLTKDGIQNIYDYTRGRLVPYQGLATLIDRLYTSIIGGSTTPVSPDLALAVSKAESTILNSGGRYHIDDATKPSRQTGVYRQPKVLVTGAAGYLGRQIVNQLVAEGYYVRAFVRRLSRTEALELAAIEICYGDLRDYDSVSAATEGMNVVVHAGAALRGSTQMMVESAVRGTKNVARAATNHEVEHVIYISSMAVYDFLSLRNGDLITDSSRLEPRPEQRGTATLAKCLAEDVALTHMNTSPPYWTILRPGLLFGNGSDVLSPVGRRLGKFLVCFGSPQQRLRLIHVRDVARTIVTLIESRCCRGRLFLLAHTDVLTLGEYISRYVNSNGFRPPRVIYIRQWMASLAAILLRMLHVAVSRIPTMSKSRIAYIYRNVTVDSSPIRRVLGVVAEAPLSLQLDRAFPQPGSRRNLQATGQHHD